MTAPQYVNEISDVYAEMYNPPGNDRLLTEKEVNDDKHDYDIPKWKRLLNQHAQAEKSKRPPHAAHVEPREDASEEEEWDGPGMQWDGIDDPDPKYNLAIKLVQEILGEEEHSEVAANTVYMIRDLVK